MNIFTCIAIILMVAGALFKIQHWPGAAIILVLSQLFLSLFFLPMYYIYIRKGLNGWKARFTAGFGIFCLSLFMIAVLFKIMHWPGGGPLFLIAFVFFSLIFVPSYCIQRVRLSANRAEKSMNIFGSISVSLFSLGILFKWMHWPGASVMIIIGAFLFLVVFLPLMIRAYRNDSQNRADKLIRLYFISTLVCILISLTIGDTSKSVFMTFPIIEEGINSLTEKIELKNDISYKSSSSDNTNAGLKTKLEKVQQLSNDLDSYINDLRSFLIVQTEGMPKEIADSVSLFDVNAKDNYDVPTHVLIGGDPENVFQGRYSARELKNKIMVFKMDLLKMVGDANRAQVEKLIGLQTNDIYDTEAEQTRSWEYKYFYHKPLGSTITVLSHIQSNVRFAESEIIATIKNQNSDKAVAE